MGKLSGLGAPISPEKIEGLRQALGSDRVVKFKNGSQIEYQDCETCEATGELAPTKVHGAVVADPKPCPTCGGEKVRVLVTRPAGGVARYRLDTELRSAYAMALRGPEPRKQPPGDPTLFGGDAPW